ncbi:MAG: nucleotide exchange factor GrpE [Thermoplasmatota archaeon]
MAEMLREGGPCPACGAGLRPVSRFQYAQDLLRKVEVIEEHSTPATANVACEWILSIRGFKCDRGHLFSSDVDLSRTMVPCPNPGCRSYLQLVNHGGRSMLRCEDRRRCSVTIYPIPRLTSENVMNIAKEVKRIGWDTTWMRANFRLDDWFKRVALTEDYQEKEEVIEVRPKRKKSRKEEVIEVRTRGPRTRIDKEVSIRVKESTKGIIMNMIETLDNLARAMDDARKFEDINEVSRMLSGLEAIKKGALRSLEQRNVKAISPHGQRFDPNFHEAVSVVIDNEMEPNSIVKVELDGYLLEGMVLRPAIVVVSKHGKEETMDWETEEWD